MFSIQGTLIIFAVVVESLSHVWLFVTPRTAASQAPLSSTISQNLLKFMSIESVMLSDHLILCHPLLLLPSIFSIIKVFSSETTLHIRWPKYWSFSLSISSSNEYSGLISSRVDWLDWFSYLYETQLSAHWTTDSQGWRGCQDICLDHGPLVTAHRQSDLLMYLVWVCNIWGNI